MDRARAVLCLPMINRTPPVLVPSAEPPIRVALRIDAGSGPAYLAAAVEQLLQVDGAEVVLALVVPRARARTRLMMSAQGLLNRAYDAVERSVLRGGSSALSRIPPATLPASTRHLVGGAPSEQAAAIVDARADVLVDLATDDAASELPIPGSGRWRLRYAMGVEGPRGGGLGRPSVAHDLAEAVLAIECATGEWMEACRAVGATQRIGFTRSRDALYWRSASFPARRLARLVSGESIGGRGDEPVLGHHARLGSDNGRSVGAPPMLGLLVGVVGHLLNRLAFRRSWVVLTRDRLADEGPPAGLQGFQAVDPPSGQFYADPFVVTDGPTTRLYVEDSPVGRHRGRIVELTRVANGWTEPVVVLADLNHRAYPHVARTSKGLLMTPDNGRAGGVDLFRHAGADAGWVLVGHCLDRLAASDPTLLEHDGRFWLFVAVTGRGMNPWDELHLYSAPDLEGPWHPHPANPVVADVRRARPAGRIFRVDDAFIRPAQDCSTAYGRRNRPQRHRHADRDRVRRAPDLVHRAHGRSWLRSHPHLQRRRADRGPRRLPTAIPVRALGKARRRMTGALPAADPGPQPQIRRRLRDRSLVRPAAAFSLGAIALAVVLLLNVLPSQSDPSDVPLVAPSPLVVSVAPPSSVTSRQLVSVPSSIDDTGSTDVTDVLQSFIDAVPDGSTIRMAAGGLYRVEGTLRLRGRMNLDWDGAGATIEATTIVDTNRRNIWIDNSRWIRIHDLTIRGANPIPGEFAEAHQFEHGIWIDGGSDIEIADVTIERPRGDCVYVGDADGALDWAARISIHDSSCHGPGRNGVAIVAGHDIRIEANRFERVGLHVVDIEPNRTDGRDGTQLRPVQGATNVAVIGNQVEGPVTGYFFAANGWGPIARLNVLDNVLHGSALRMTVQPLLDSGYVRAEVVIRGNQSNSPYDATEDAAMTFTRNVDLTIRGNSGPLKGAGSALIEVRDSCRVDIGGNVFPGGAAEVRGGPTACPVATNARQAPAGDGAP